MSNFKNLKPNREFNRKNRDFVNILGMKENSQSSGIKYSSGEAKKR